MRVKLTTVGMYLVKGGGAVSSGARYCLRSLSKPQVDAPYKRHLRAIFILLSSCLIVGMLGPAYPNAPLHFYPINGPDALAHLTVKLSRLFGTGSMSDAYIVASFAFCAYIVRLFFREIYGGIEVGVGAILAAASLDVLVELASSPTPNTYGTRAALFAFSSGVYVIIRGMGNMVDGVIVKPKDL